MEIVISAAHTTRERLCGSLACGAGIVTVAVGFAVLLGWGLNIPALKSLAADDATMKPLTAICFGLCGLALALSAPGRKRFMESRAKATARTAAGLAVVISLAVSLEYSLRRTTGIDELLFRTALLATRIPHPGRMAPATVLAVLLLGLSLFLLDAEFAGAFRISGFLGLLAALTGMIGMLGYLYGVEALYRFAPYFAVAPHTSLLMFALGIGTLLSRPRRGISAEVISDLSGGWIARRLLPVVVLAPMVFGWLGLRGERAGLYGAEFGLALFAGSNMVLLAAVVWQGARSLNRADRQRRLADEATIRSTAELASAGDRLRASEERFRLFMDHLPAAAFLKDRQGRYVWANASWRRQFPEDWGDLLGRTDADLWAPEAAAVFIESDARVIEGEAPIQLSETSGAGADLRQWLVSKFPIQGPGGVSLIGGVAVDITQSKRLEDQLHQAQKLEALGLLAGGVAHDFNNLLTVIMGYAELCRTDREDRATLLRSLDEIRDAAARAAALTRQLLAFGRKQVTQPRLISVNTELTAMEPILRRVVRKDVTLNLTPAQDLGVVKLDPVQIQQIILNLAMNAQDAMPTGGSLTIETANVELDQSYAQSHREVTAGLYVRLAVTDTGTGMDASTLAHAFDPFFTTKVPGMGTGLGLATVYGIVKQSGGHVWVYSEPGRGTSFKIYFPRAEAEALFASEAERPTSESAAKATGTLLIVEDEDSLRSLMVQACQRVGYEVLEARSGEEALALIATHPAPIHLLVVDAVMPGIGGRTLADQIAERRPETKVLFCSGYAENAIVQHGVLAPGVEFLQKPFTPTALLGRIRALLAPAP